MLQVLSVGRFAKYGGYYNKDTSHYLNTRNMVYPIVVGARYSGDRSQTDFNDLIDLITMMLLRDPRARASPTEALQMPFLHSVPFPRTP
jgi:serine/threonine protein kinase